jgi:2-polyprenyl-3-methyl-5-hydroxy-6-metoxy-1,4-benzoquinol methylase
MTPGKLARLVLGRAFPLAASVYRSFFLDIDALVQSISHQLPPNAKVVDVGCGDGLIIERLLVARPDIHVTLIDVAREIGRGLDPAKAARYRLLPETSIDQFLAQTSEHFDAVTILDVLHHIAFPQRGAFLRELARLCAQADRLIFKDVESGSVMGRLAFWADRYISGDKYVALVPSTEALRYLQSALPGWRLEVVKQRRPNYCVMAESPALSLKRSA